ncbi:GntR family transcriptional regulator [Paenibacillus solisilvae]|uniref:GntR family transcriptional regulator n=1 Tax=Paenibacillus solisilvae TaxID=2486751 RepID=A0ABW0VZY3_9BACL
MFLELDLQSDVPIYTQIAQQIIEGIASGVLQPGDPLPSVRSLASDLSINLHTVNKAYQALKQEGFLQVHRKRGVIVTPDGMPRVSESFLDSMHLQLRSLAAEAIVRGMTEKEFADACIAIYRRDLTKKGDYLE